MNRTRKTINGVVHTFLLCVFISTVFASTTFISTVRAADSKQFKAYKKYIKEISRCADVACYRSVIMRRGSEDAINALNKSADKFVQKTFELEKKKAKERRKRGSIYVVEEIMEGDIAILRLSSKTYRALNETIYLVLEEEKWKVGKASKKSEVEGNTLLDRHP